MPIYILALVAVLLIPIVESSFNCRNQGNGVCLNGGNCNIYGDCDCLPDLKGYDCGLYSPLNYTRPPCNVECQNGGTCRYGNECYCPYEYVGDRCQYPRNGPICKRDMMMLVAYRGLTFKGELYINKHKTACKFVPNQSEIPGMVKFFRPLQFKKSKYGCKPHKTVDRTTGDITYSVDVVSTYHYGEFGNTDSLIRMACVFKGRRPGHVRDTTGETHHIKIRTINPDTQDPIQVLKENQKVILHFKPEGIKDATGAMVHFLEIYSRRGSNIVKRRLVEDGCVIQPGHDEKHGPVKIYSELKDGFYIGKVEFKTFILIPGEPLLFNYRLRLCQGICPWPKCPTPSTTPTPALPIVV